MWDGWHLTGYIVRGLLWAFCCPPTRGIWDREIALWYLSSWAQGLPSRVTVHMLQDTGYVHLWGTYFIFNSNNALFKEVLSLFYRWEKWGSKTTLLQGLQINKWWILIWIQVQDEHDCHGSSWIQAQDQHDCHGWSVCEKCQEYAIWMNQWL